MTPPNDRELGQLAEAVNGLRRDLDRDRGETRDWRDENTPKIDQILDLKPVIEANTRWIETEGKPALLALRDARSGLRGVRLGIALSAAGVGGGALAALTQTGGAVVKALVAGLARVFQ